jgi:hypothetical protein
MDTGVAGRYCLVVAPDPGSCSAQFGEQQGGPDFYFQKIDPGARQIEFDDQWQALSRPAIPLRTPVVTIISC